MNAEIVNQNNNEWNPGRILEHLTLTREGYKSNVEEIYAGLWNWNIKLTIQF